MIERLLIRMARWAHRPPSWRMVKFVLALLTALLAVAAIEKWVGWPEWMTAERIRPGKIGRLIRQKEEAAPATRDAAPGERGKQQEQAE